MTVYVINEVDTKFSITHLTDTYMCVLSFKAITLNKNMF